MKQRIFTLFLLLFPFLLHGMGLTLPGPATHIAIQNGNWNQASTWNSNSVPGNNAIVVIPNGIRVRVTSQESARLKFIQVDGEMRMAIHDDCRLLVETIQVSPTGFFMIGNPVNHMATGKTAEIVFISDGTPIDQTWDPKELSRGFLSMGKVRMYGKPVTHLSEMNASMTKNRTALNLQFPVPTDWEIGDSIVLAGTYFHRDEDLQDEVFAIAGINGTTITLDHPTQYDHWRVRTDMMLHVAHLTRNVIFRSESSAIALRGHIMLMNSDVDVRHVAFKDLGRTDKNKPLDEIEVDLITGAITPGPFNNRRGRYSLHFHQNGIQPGQEPPSKVYGCVVQRTPGWGFVNHSSHVDFRENVCHDFLGAAFVTEQGDELGNFFDNIAIHGVGEDAPGTTNQAFDLKYKPTRIVFNNPYRPQVISDFAFSGDAFWFQGPAVRARNNVANSCNGSGMIWFATGAVDIATDDYQGFPRSAVAGAYAGYPNIGNLQARNWNHGTDSLIISDLPILECNGLDAYACLVGFRLRFVNFSNNAFYVEAARPWDYTQDIVPLPGKNNSYAVRLREKVENLNLWNNETGFRMRYNEKTDYVNVKNINRLDFHPRLAYIGAEHFHQSKSVTFDGLITSGYAVAGMLISNNEDNSSQVTFSNKTYGSYSNADYRKTQVSCPEITGMAENGLSANSVTISWNNHPSAVRFLIRYKVETHQKWRYLNPTGLGTTSATLNNLIAGQNYVYQINAGCPENVSLWSWPAYFSTPTSKTALSEAEAGIRVFPNPMVGKTLQVEAPEAVEIRGLTLYDARGIRIRQWPGVDRSLELPDDLPAGVYLLRMQLAHTERNFRLVRQ